MVVDVNQYKILIIVKNEFKLILDKNFMNLLGFSKYVINPGYDRSDLIPNIDKTKYLKFFVILLIIEMKMNFYQMFLLKME